LLITFWK